MTLNDLKIYYFIAPCTLIPQLGTPMLSRITWDFPKLLGVSCWAKKPQRNRRRDERTDAQMGKTRNATQ